MSLFEGNNKTCNSTKRKTNNKTQKIDKNIKFGAFLICVGLLFIAFSVGIKFMASSPFEITDPSVLMNRTSQDLKLFEFQIDNVNYEVPIASRNFLLADWEFSEDPFIPASETIPVVIEKDEKRLFLIVKNESEELCKASESTVIQVLIESSRKEEETPIYFGKNGFTLKMNYEQIEQIFGKPHKTKTEGNIQVCSYRYGTSAAIDIVVDKNIGTTSIVYNRK